MRALLILATILALAPAARADKDQDDAKALLDTLATSASKDERVDAAAKLADLAPRVIDQLSAFLTRTRTSTTDQRRAVLAKIKASVPDKKGNFQSPGHEAAAKVRADDDFDWLALLVAQQPMPGLGDVIADDAVIRALAGSKRTEAAKAILDAAFKPDTIIYRDECGRYLRKMAPYSVPALIVASQVKHNYNLSRYSNYQIERVDRQEPGKALASAAGDEDLRIAILEAYGQTEHREAVGAVATYLDDESPRVRAEARKVWLEYVTPPDPPPPPKKHLQIAGGEQADKETPLYLNSLQLARIEIQRITTELGLDTVAEDAGDPALQAASQAIFAYYDQQRAARDAGDFAGGKQKADAGDLAGAVAVFDRLIAEDPARKERGEMAPIYFQYAEQLAKDQKWSDASAMYSKAHGLAPDGAQAQDALAAEYFALGKAQEADGKDGSAAYRKAVALKPDYAEAKQEEKRVESGGGAARSPWMLYAAGGVAAIALMLLMMGVMRRPARR